MKFRYERLVPNSASSIARYGRSIDGHGQIDTISLPKNNSLGKSMAATLQDLLAQKEALEAQITKLRATEQAEAISKIRKLIEDNDLTQADIFPSSKSSEKTRKTSSGKVPAKYRDPISKSEWSGRGLAPKWLAGKNKDDFLIG